MKKVSVFTSGGEISWIVENPDAWIQEGIEKNWWGAPGEFQFEIEDMTLQLQQEKETAEALDYLQKTDWFIIREMDSGVPCPEEIKTKRQEARAKVVR